MDLVITNNFTTVTSNLSNQILSKGEKMKSILVIIIIIIFAYGCASKKPMREMLKKSLDRSVTLQWEANTEPDLDGYKAYYDIETKCPNNEETCNNPDGVYSNNIDVPLSSLSDITNPEVTISGLDTTLDYFLSVTAYDNEDLESDNSNQVAALAVSEPPIPPDITLIDITLLWDANIEPDLFGYKVYWSLISGTPYENFIALYESDFIDWSNPEYTLNLDSCLTWYFVVTAFDIEVPSKESDYSNEVSQLESCPPDPPTNVLISF
jgi:hypothetical protein